jgi:hypothetical protein
MVRHPLRVVAATIDFGGCVACHQEQCPGADDRGWSQALHEDRDAVVIWAEDLPKME